MGLELADFLGVIVAFTVVLNLSSGIVFPLLFAAGLHGLIWVVKRGKPPGWTRQAILDLRRPAIYCAGMPDHQEETYPHLGDSHD